MTTPLAGIKVLDLSNYVTTPGAGMLLADYGADVVKVEAPRGDETRRMGVTPPAQAGQGKYFQVVNRGKQGIVVDATKPEGRAILHRLAARSDVVLQNYRPGLAKKFGLDYETLRALNPRLIYVQVSGFGSQGPHQHKPAYDMILQGYSGAMYVRPEEKRRPAPFPVLIVDCSTPMLVAYGVMLGLYHRERTGLGQKVETSMLAAAMMMQNVYFIREDDTDPPTLPSPSRATEVLPSYGSYQTADGWLNVGAINEAQYVALCKILGLDDLIADPELITTHARIKRRHEIRPRLEAALRQGTTAEWNAKLEAVGVPCGPVNRIDDLFDDEHMLVNELVAEIDHPVVGKTRMLGLPIKLSETPGELRGPAPILGQHTDAVLAAAGYDAEAIAHLRELGAIQ